MRHQPSVAVNRANAKWGLEMIFGWISNWLKKTGFLVKGNFNRKKMYGWTVANSQLVMFNQRKNITNGCFAADFKGTVSRDFITPGFSLNISS